MPNRKRKRLDGGAIANKRHEMANINPQVKLRNNIRDRLRKPPIIVQVPIKKDSIPAQKKPIAAQPPKSIKGGELITIDDLPDDNLEGEAFVPEYNSDDDPDYINETKDSNDESSSSGSEEPTKVRVRRGPPRKPLIKPLVLTPTPSTKPKRFQKRKHTPKVQIQEVISPVSSSADESNDDSGGDSGGESNDDSGDESKDDSGDESKDDSGGESKDDSGDESKEESESDPLAAIKKIIKASIGQKKNDDDQEYKSQMEKLKKSDPVLYKELKKTREYLIKDKPNIEKIMKLSLLTKDKAEILEWFEVFMVTDPLSEEFIVIKDKIKTLIKEAKHSYCQHQLMSKSEHKKIDAEIERVKYKNIQTPLNKKIMSLETTDENKSALLQIFDEMQKQSKTDGDSEYPKMKKMLDIAVRLPFDKTKGQLRGGDGGDGKNDGKFFIRMKEKLDQSFYGLESVKEQLMIYLNSRARSSHMKQNCIGLIGPPGVGKTSIIKLLRDSFNYPMARVSCGRIGEVEALRGFSFTWVGSGPGAITNAMIKTGDKECIIVLDEFEKIAENPKLLPSLLELIDPEQNDSYEDNYFPNIKIDLSKVWFVMCMNSAPTDTALNDRIYKININGYTYKEKVQIVLNHVLPGLIKNIGMQKDIIIDENGARSIVSRYAGTQEKGVRSVIGGATNAINTLRFIKDNPGVKTRFQMKKIKWPVRLTTELLNHICPDGVEKHLSMYV